MTTFAGSIADTAADTAVQVAPARKAPTTTQNTSNLCVGRRLRVRRTSFGMSEKKLCDKLGIDCDDLDAYEQGAKRVGANLLLRIADLLDVRPDYFFHGYTPEELRACLEPSL
jgi:ribosome-binding protein aMBF1 (putative translation factor)